MTDINEPFAGQSPQELASVRDTAQKLLKIIQKVTWTRARLQDPAQFDNAVQELLDRAERDGLIDRKRMLDSGMIYHSSSVFGQSVPRIRDIPALSHVFHRATRACNILANPNGYIPPVKPLYG